MTKPIDIAGLDKAEVLRALFNASQPLGLGALDPRSATDLTIEEARAVVNYRMATGGRWAMDFDYLNGRVLKVDMTNDTLDPDLFDRDNGEGVAAAAIAQLRSTVAS